jgi:lipoprotein-releasing system permease protein
MVVQPIDRPLDDYAALATRFKAVDGVLNAIPMVEGQTLASGVGGAGTGALVRGIRVEDLQSMKIVSDNIRTGDLVGFTAGEGVLVGSRMAQSLGLGAGDLITLVAPEGDVTPFGVNPRVKAYPISGIFEIGMSEYDGTIAFMPLEEAQLFFNQEGIVTGIEVFTDDPDSVGPMRTAVEEGAGRPAFVSDWRARNMTFFSALEVERNVMFLILTLIVLVAALNIISGMTMLVKDKGRDIAILRTMGATRGTILRVFLITGASIGIVGTLAGFALGFVVCLNVESIRQGISWLTSTELFSPELYFLSRLPADMDTGETFTVVVMAMVLSLLATLYPAWRAARLDPVEALRYE